ncbi:MAG: hypothetical protein JSS27_01155 [Planctomycetes bacterium]|nr:hypothetical protein [Planctomycetota bacterium]
MDSICRTNQPSQAAKSPRADTGPTDTTNTTADDVTCRAITSVAAPVRD